MIFEYIETYKSFNKLRIRLFKTVLYLSLNFIRQREINVLKSKLEGLERGIEGTCPEKGESTH